MRLRWAASCRLAVAARSFSAWYSTINRCRETPPVVGIESPDLRGARGTQPSASTRLVPRRGVGAKASALAPTRKSRRCIDHLLDLPGEREAAFMVKHADVIGAFDLAALH